MDPILILKRTIAVLVAAGHVQGEKVNEAYGLAVKSSGEQGDTHEDPLHHETVDGKWWLFFLDVPVGPLSDEEAASVVWDEASDVVEEIDKRSVAEAIHSFNRALQVGQAIMRDDQ